MNKAAVRWPVVTGTILLVYLASVGTGGTVLADGVTITGQLWVQVLACAAVGVWSLAATVLIVFVTRRAVGLRATQEEEIEGLDLSHHGETAYRL